MSACNLKILGLYLLTIYYLIFCYPLVVNVGHITETFSRKVSRKIRSANADARMKKSTKGVVIMQPTKLEAVADPHSNGVCIVLGASSHCEFIPWSFGHCMKDVFFNS